MEKNIHWFPGHMKKALNEIEEKVKLIDVVIEILDARAPLASMNPFLENRIANKPHLIVISKSDLADPLENEKWLSYFKSKGYAVIIGDLKDRNIIRVISKELVTLSIAKREKEARRGMKPQAIKSMIVGIPNVGKSTLINKIAKRPSAGVENRPGFTRAEQWIKVDKDFMLLDTPGVLPMNYDSQEEAAKLALIGSIREDILPYDILVTNLLKFLRQYYPNSLKERFGVNEIKDDDTVINDICIKRGLLSSGKLDFQRGRVLLIKEFKDGLLGRMSLERL
ncbi:MAG: ribosome biogenesis GTPase YlqF [Erysipelotrichaceae bacterium]|nr:ribosome biogenesis GTPase YlqF [Erysipelotrichaceae bacterium]